MKKNLILSFIILSQVCFAQISSEKSAQIDAAIAKYVKDDAPGMAILVVRDGKILHEKGYGLANLQTRTSIDSNTIFEIASVAKPFTAMAVMMLAECGKLSYQDSLDKFFPNASASMKKIAVRDLLYHTSGIPDYSVLAEENSQIKKQSRAWKSTEDVAEFISILPKLDFPTGARWEYSNSNYVLLAEIVEKVSGQKFPQFIKENIFQPLAMNSSSVGVNPALSKNYAVGYAAGKQGFEQPKNPLSIDIYGDGYIYTTLEDLYKFDQALYTEKLLKNSTLGQAFDFGKLSDGTKVTYGFGWGLGNYLEMPYVSHGGDGYGFYAELIRFPEQKFTVAILCNNQQLPAPFAFANKIAQIYFGDNISAPKAKIVDEKVLQSYVGKYNLYDLVVNITLEKGLLWFKNGSNKVKLLSASDTEFFVEGQPSLFIEFNKNEKGIARCFSFLDQNGIQLCKQ
ncbi:MAG: serine hydrolase [Acidobacteriota bacterium]|nr:serine hydrolase [Acidobacteriota bacterium]